MADRDIIIGRLINVTGMIGVLAGLVLFTFAIVLLLFRRGFGFDIASSLHLFWSQFGAANPCLPIVCFRVVWTLKPTWSEGRV